MTFYKKIRIYKPKLICLLLYISPFIDVFTGFCKLNGFSIDWCSVVFKTILFLVCFGTHIKYSNNKELFKLCLILCWVFISIVWHMNGLSDLSLIIEDISQYIKLFLPLVLFFSISNLKSRHLYNNKSVENVIIYYLFFYPLSIIIPKILGIGFHTYGRMESGYKGFYYGGNGINILQILLMLLSVYKLIYESKTLKNYVLVGLNVISTMLIGTKSSIITMGYLVLLVLFFNNEKRERKKSGFWLVFLLILFLSLFLFYKTNESFIENIIFRLQWEIKRVNGNYLDFITNSRIKNGFPYFIMAIQNDNWGLNILCGVGYTKFLDVVEMDLIDIILHFGFVILYVIAFFYFRRIKKISSMYMKAVVLFALVYAFWAGHLLITPMSSIVLVLICTEDYSKS